MFGDYTFKITTTFLRVQWVKYSRWTYRLFLNFPIYIGISSTNLIFAFSINSPLRLSMNMRSDIIAPHVIATSPILFADNEGETSQ